MGRLQQCIERLGCAPNAPGRRESIERLAGADRRAWRTVSLLFGALLVVQVWWRARLTGLALLCGSHVLVSEGLVQLISRRLTLGLWVSHRELLVAAGALHQTWALLQLVAGGGLNLFRYHLGSWLCLLAAMLCSNTAAWRFGCCLLGPLQPLPPLVLPQRWATAVLSLLVLQPVFWGGRICQRLLQEPGVEAPLWDLYSMLGLLHSIPVFPTFSAHDWSEASPMHQCLAVNSWSLLVLGLALPLQLLSLHRGEQRQRQLRRQVQRDGQGLGARRQQQQQPQPAGDPEAAAPPQPDTHWLLNFCMLSCLAWFAVHNALQLWLWLRPAPDGTAGGGAAARPAA